MEDKNNRLKMGTAVILTNGKLDHPDAKTAHGLIRGTERFDITGVIDNHNKGRDAGEVLDGIHRNIPVFRDLDAYIVKQGFPPDYAIIGVALSGGGLNDEWQDIAVEILEQGVSLVNGMHMHLSTIPKFQEIAASNGTKIIDIRKPKNFDQMHFWSGKIYQMKIPRIAVLGTDCAIGKRTTSRLIVETCKAGGINAEMIYTGQTGWLQGNPHGFILDATLNDFVSGEIEAAIVACEKETRPDLIVVEGQSGLRNPLGPCGSELIVSGNIKGVVLQHAPFRRYIDDAEDLGCLLPDLDNEIKLVEMYGSRVIAIALNGEGGCRNELLMEQKIVEDRLKIPVILPLEANSAGMQRFLPVIESFMQSHNDLPDTVCRKIKEDSHA